MMRREFQAIAIAILLLTLAFFASVGSASTTRLGPHTVTFVIDMRQEIAGSRFDSTRDEVGVRGGVAPLSWETTLLATDPDADGRYEVTVAFSRAPFGGQAVTYKFKMDRVADPREGWEEGRNRQLFLRQSAQTVTRLFNAPPDPVVTSRVGTIHAHPAFPSRIVAPRDVQVYLPPGYERERPRRYPVLYLHDGQNVFDAASMGMEWQVDETAEALIQAGRIEPLIVVAVANTDARRDEYTPTYVEWKRPDGSTSKGGGKANLYGRFLTEELKPFIDRTYCTRQDAASTAVGGASLGGLVSLWLALEHPRVFGNALAVSTAVEWDDNVILKKIAALPRMVPVRVWVDAGSRENEKFVSGARRLRDALARKGWKPGTDLEYVEQEGGQHDEISWASRVEGMLSFLYGRPKSLPAKDGR
jgi:predicted alpha/beta superfamily hydrolase